MLLKVLATILLLLCIIINAEKYYTPAEKLKLREQVREMFYHAYDNYLLYAYDYDELRPLTCDGTDTWGSYSLTLIDALDTLAIMGNYSEFRRVANILEHKLNFERDINVSVFETNIRVVGGLLSAHLFSKRAGIAVEEGWPCQGPLLRLAEDLVKRLLPAFDTGTGMPYGTVNLRYGVPKGETPVTCTAGVGTFLIEFGAMSRLTGNPIYEDVALNAIYALWERRSAIGLFGNHIDVQTGRWTALDAGIGAGVDSYFEYLVKGATLLNRPNLLGMFNEARQSIDKYMKKDDWYVWVNMNKGQITLPVFQSLEAFWPGVLSLIGDTSNAMRSLIKYSSVWEKYGFLPEFYNIATMQVTANRESYPLRPELVESLWYLYRSTENQFLLDMGERMLNTINFSARTKCGYATIRNVLTHEKENRMESFFLAETTKYLYLLFDEDNFVHMQGEGDIIETAHGVCLANAGAYIFNTEAHPIDMSALYCCHDLKEDIFEDLNWKQFSDEALLRADRKEIMKQAEEYERSYECNENNEKEINKQKTPTKSAQDVAELYVDIEVYDENNQPMGDALVYSFEKITQTVKNEENVSKSTTDKLKKRKILTKDHFNAFFSMERNVFTTKTAVLEFVVSFMQNFTLNETAIKHLNAFNTDLINLFPEKHTYSLWELFVLQQADLANSKLAKQFVLHVDNAENVKTLKTILSALNGANNTHDEQTNEIFGKISLAQEHFQRQLVNTTAMQEFIANIVTNNTAETFQYKILLQAEEIKSLPLPKLNQTLSELFAKFQHSTELKLQMIETFERLNELMLDKNLSNSTQEVPIAKYIKEGDIKKSADYDHDKESLQNLTENEKNAKIREKIKNNASVWQQLMQKILSSTISQPLQFDEEQLYKKIRQSLQRYKSQKYTTEDYRLFSCPQQTFLEQFAYRNFYPPA